MSCCCCTPCRAHALWPLFGNVYTSNACVAASRSHLIFVSTSRPHPGHCCLSGGGVVCCVGCCNRGTMDAARCAPVFRVYCKVTVVLTDKPGIVAGGWEVGQGDLGQPVRLHGNPCMYVDQCSLFCCVCMPECAVMLQRICCKLVMPCAGVLRVCHLQLFWSLWGLTCSVCHACKWRTLLAGCVCVCRLWHFEQPLHLRL
jgi:hypothetical protein